MTIDNLLIENARLVSGKTTSWEPVKDDDGKPKLSKTSGQPLFSNWCYLAVPKQYFLEKVWPVMVQEAASIYPNAVNIHPDNYEQDRFFSWKIIDGDSPLTPPKNPESTPYNQREGFAGHYIIKASKYGFCPDTTVFQNGRFHKLEDSQIKTGDYFDVSFTIEAHKGQSPGLYWNPNGYNLVKIGDAIISESRGNPQTMFGNSAKELQGSLPQVGQVTPQLPTAPVGLPQQASFAPVGLPQQASFAPVNPQQPVQPAHDFVQNAMGNPAPVGLPQAHAMQQLPTAPQMVGGTAAPATSYPGNVGIPGLPQPR